MRTPFAVGLVVVALIWGGSFVFIKVMLEELGPLAIAWTRLGGGGVFILALVVLTGRRMPSRAALLDITVVAALSSALPYFLIPWGEREVASGLAAILNASTPFFAAVFAHAVLTAERLTRQRAAGLAVGFAGVALVIGPDLRNLASSSTMGQLAVVLASASYGAGAVYLRRRLLGIDSMVLAGLQSAIAFALLTPVLMLVEGVPDLAALSGRVAMATAGLAVLSSGIAIVIYYWLLRNLHAAQAALVTYLVPVTAVFWGWLALDERVGVAVVPGLMLIMAGIYLVNRRPRNAGLPPGAAPTSPPSAPRAQRAR